MNNEPIHGASVEQIIRELEAAASSRHPHHYGGSNGKDKMLIKAADAMREHTMPTVADMAPIDRRQRLVAAAMILAVDMPADLGQVARSMLGACKVCPGLYLDEIPALTESATRLRMLTFARDLIQTMINEDNTSHG